MLWEKKNSYGYGRFTVEGVSRRPDLVLYRQPFFAFVLEVKPGQHRAETRKSIKIVDYLSDVQDGRAKYCAEPIQGQETSGPIPLTPRCFLTASHHSPEGHLVQNEIVKDVRFDRAKYSQYGIPLIEYNETASHIRHLWSQWQNRDGRFSLGVLLSDILLGNLRFWEWCEQHKKESFPYGKASEKLEATSNPGDRKPAAFLQMKLPWGRNPDQTYRRVQFQQRFWPLHRVQRRAVWV